MTTHWLVRRERCSPGSSCLSTWSASSLMILWYLWVLLWLPWPVPAEQVSGGRHGGKALHGSLSSSSLLSTSSSSDSSSPSSSSLFSTRQSGGQLDWLLSEKGPFQRCPEYTEFRERFQQGFSTRYKIYRWDRSAHRCLCVCVCVGEEMEERSCVWLETVGRKIQINQKKTNSGWH